MDYFKVTKDGDNCGVDLTGNPIELAEAIYTCMEEDKDVAAIITAAFAMYDYFNPSSE